MLIDYKFLLTVYFILLILYFNKMFFMIGVTFYSYELYRYLHFMFIIWIHLLLTIKVISIFPIIYNKSILKKCNNKYKFIKYICYFILLLLFIQVLIHNKNSEYDLEKYTGLINYHIIYIIIIIILNYVLHHIFNIQLRLEEKECIPKNMKILLIIFNYINDLIILSPFIYGIYSIYSLINKK